MNKLSNLTIIQKLNYFSIIGALFALVVLNYFLIDAKDSVYKNTVVNLKSNLDDRISVKNSVGLTNIISISNDERISEAVIRGDKERLASILSDLSKEFRQRTNLKNIKIQIHTKDNKSFFRNWTKKSGDDLSWRDTVSVANRDKKDIVAFEVGKAGLSLKAITPLYDKNKNHIGSIEFIQGLNSVAKRFKKIDDGFLLLMDKAMLSTATFIKNKKEVGNYIVAQKFVDNKFIEDSRKIDFKELMAKDYYIGEHFLFTYDNVVDSTGQRVGIMLVGANIDKVDNMVVESSYLVYVSVFIILFSIMIVQLLFRFAIVKPLISVVDSINQSSEQIQHSSDNLNEGSQNLSNMAVQQSASVEEITATIESILKNVNDNFSSMKELEDLGKEMESNASVGYNHMIELKDSMEDISSSSQEINNLVNTIDEISFQTNLLALNAAVEAARAGEHGLGFAVVSEEVRSLATRSADEAKKIHEVIQKAVNKSKQGIIVANNTNDSFKLIVDKINATMSLIQCTTQASQEQKLSIEQLKNTMTEVDSVTHKLSVNSEEISGMSTSLHNETKNSKDVISELVKMI
jgi:methyl-accepting chemotaxis protein